MRTRCSAAADGIEPRDAEVVIIVTAPAKGDRGLRESERHVAKGAGVWGQGEGGRGVGPRVYPTAYPVTSHLIPTRARCPCVALEGKAIVLRHWLMLSEVVIIVCRHRQPSGRLTPVPPPLSQPPPSTPHPRCPIAARTLGGAPRARPSSPHEVARWRPSLSEAEGGGGTAEALRRRPGHAHLFLLTCHVGCARGEGDGGDGRRACVVWWCVCGWRAVGWDEVRVRVRVL